MCACIKIAESDATKTAEGEATAAGETSGDDGAEGKNQSILQIKLRKVVVLIGKLG